MKSEAELKEKLKFATSPQQQVELIFEYIWFNFDLLSYGNIPLLEEAEKLSQSINYRRGMIMAIMARGHLKLSDSNSLERKTPAELNEILKECLEEFRSIGDSDGMGKAYNLLAYMSWWQGAYENGLSYGIEALRAAEAASSAMGVAWGHYSLGIFHYDLKDFAASESHLQKALKKFEEIDSDFGIARVLNGLATMKIDLNRLDEAVEMLNDCIKRYEALNYLQGLSRTYNDLGVICVRKKAFQDAEKHLQDALRIRLSEDYTPGIITTLGELGNLYLLSGDLTQAESYLQQGLEMALKAKTLPKIFLAYERIATLYKLKGNYQVALEYYEKFHKLKEEVTGEIQRNKLHQLQTSFETEKSNQQAEIHRLKNVELKIAKEQIEGINKEIVASINYAKRIQTAILPPSRILDRIFPGNFVLYLPKDIVAGDFYWVAEKQDFSYLAVCDCTGHGVPGAMVSVICHNALNRAVHEFALTEPGKILDKTRSLVLENFVLSDEKVNDGMDASFIAVEKKTGKIYWAGANLPLWIYRNKTNTIEETKGNNQPVGLTDNPVPFTTHEFGLNSGDCCYLFSDGYADQFGGPHNKKLTRKNFRELVSKYSALTPQEQLQQLLSFHHGFKGQLEQLDDICIIGIPFPA